MVGLIGREPNRKTCLGYDGFYEFQYKPQNDEERETFPQHARTLALWLDNFEILFSGSVCHYGRLAPPSTQIDPDNDYIHIKILHPVPKK